MSETRIVRAAAVQIAPDLDRPDGTLERVLNAAEVPVFCTLRTRKRCELSRCVSLAPA